MNQLDLALALVLENLPDSISERTRVLSEAAALLDDKHPLRVDLGKQINSLKFAEREAPRTAAKFRNLDA